MHPIDHSQVIGQTYGRLTVTGLGEPYRATSGKTTTRYLCTCTCGKTGVLVRRDTLLKGNTRSCGCLALERQGAKRGRAPSFRDITRRSVRRTVREANDF